MLSPSAAKRRRATALDVRRVNRSTVLHHLLVDGPMSRQALSRRSGLSSATVSNVVADLIKERLVIESGLGASSGGRPGAIFAINADLGSSVGVAVAETFILFDLFDAALRRQNHYEIPLDPRQSQPECVVQHLANGIKTLLAQTATSNNLLGVGVSVPGLVALEEGISVFAPNWGWRQVPLAAMLQSHIHVPFYVDNALKFQAIAESWFGAGRGVENLITLVIGTGVGAGLIVNGSVFRGTTNSAGEWGHTTIVVGGRPCRCGNKGCVEAYVGAPGIIKTLQEIAPHSELLRASQSETIEAIVAAAHHGDPVALRTLEETARYLGVGVANLINLFNPQKIVLGGWVGTSIGPFVLPQMERILPNHAMSQPLSACQIVISELGRGGFTMGAATLALERFMAHAGNGADLGDALDI